MFIFLNCILVFVAYCDGRTWEETLNNVTIKVKLTSGNISLSNVHNEIDINFGKLYEIAFDGASQVGISGPFKHRFPTFNYQDFSESPLEEIDIPGFDGISKEDNNITAFRKSFTANRNLVGPGAHFQFHVISFNNKTLLENLESEERYLVYNGTVQIIFSIGQWKFCEQDDICLNDGTRERGGFLDMFTNFEGKRRDGPVQTSNRGANIKGGAHPKTLDYGGVDVTFPRKYRQNITWRSLPSRYPLFNGDQSILRFARFPYQHNVVYNFFVNVSSHAYIPTTSSSNAIIIVNFWIFPLAIWFIYYL